jgi:hypothetical protein
MIMPRQQNQRWTSSWERYATRPRPVSFAHAAEARVYRVRVYRVRVYRVRVYRVRVASRALPPLNLSTTTTTLSCCLMLQMVLLHRLTHLPCECTCHRFGRC